MWTKAVPHQNSSSAPLCQLNLAEIEKHFGPAKHERFQWRAASGACVRSPIRAQAQFRSRKEVQSALGWIGWVLLMCGLPQCFLLLMPQDTNHRCARGTCC